MAYYVQTNGVQIREEMEIPDEVDIPDEDILPNQFNIPNQIPLQNQNNVRNHINVPTQINASNKIVAPNEINAPSQIHISHQINDPYQINSQYQINAPIQINIPDPINISNHINVLNYSLEVQQPVQQNVMYTTKNLCRICGNRNFPTIHLFKPEAMEHCLVQKINKYLPIVVGKDDRLPLWICQSCINTLLKWHDLVETCETTDRKLSAKLNKQSKTKSGKNPKNQGGVRGDSGPTARWTPRCVNDEPICSEQDVSDTVHLHEHKTNDFNESGGSDGLASEDDQPLAKIATKKPLDLFQNFCTALTNFRNHFLKEHDRNRCDYSDFSDSSVSENDDTGIEEDLNNFDDLTHSNMRKDKMDEETRLELSQVQTKINGKVFFTCTTCGKNLSSTHTYIFHKRIHTGERPCVCHICGKQFRAPNGLQRHLTETHEKQRRYICVMCTKNFANSQNLKQHIRIHTGERPFVCPHCGKRFTQSGSLHVHLKTHSEQFPYHCAECGAKFRLRSGLTRHRLKHTGERPHVCVHCGKGFRQKHELNSHVLTHTDTKPHTCAVCGTAFRQRRALRHHCKRLHESEPREMAEMVYDHGGAYE